MTLNRIEDNLKAFLLNPKRGWPNKTPRVTNYKDKSVKSKILNGIMVSTESVDYTQNMTLGGDNKTYKNVTIALTFYDRDKKTQNPFIENQRYLNLFFRERRNNNFEVAQLVELKNVNNDWQATPISNHQDHYFIYGDKEDPSLDANKSYFGYLTKNTTGNHFLYRLKESWKILDLSSHLVFPVSRIRGNFAEVNHGGDTFLYEFVLTNVFDGSQFIQITESELDYNEEDQDYADMIMSVATLSVMDYSQDEPEREQEIFETVVNPSHPYSPTIYNDKFLITTTSPDASFSTSEWQAGTKVKNSLQITFPANSQTAYRGIGYSADRISGLQQVGNPFGNIFNTAYESNGIQQIDGVYYYTYKTRHAYFPVTETHTYNVTPDPDRDAFIVSYLTGDTGEVHTPDDFSFNEGEIEVDPNRNYYELALNADPRSYIAIGFTGQINRILDGTKNLRHSFTPTIDRPFVQKVIRNRIYNVFVSNITFFTFGSVRLYYS